jgi:alkylation response protein AidB-like acyl-CoA dehydrogenase
VQKGPAITLERSRTLTPSSGRTSTGGSSSSKNNAVQTYSGMGFAEDNDMECFFRDVRLFKTSPALKTLFKYSF